MVVILSQRTNTQKLHKVSHFQFRKNYIKKLSCTKSNNFLLNIQLDMLLERVRLLRGLNNRCKDLAYIHFF